MAVINRYSNQAVAAYNPMSMQELAFAPTFLRQRHDQAAEALSQLDVQSGQYDVLNQYQPIANQLVDPLQKEIQSLAEKLATEGINRSQAVPQAMKLKSQYSNMFGQAGGIGQLQNATKQYRTQAQQIQEFFKDAPELANYTLSRMTPGQAQLQDGKLTLGQMNNPNYVKDIPESEILKDLNTAASQLKDTDLGDYGLQGKVDVNNFDSIVTLASGKGVSAQRAMDLIQNLVGQDQWNSLQQRGAMLGLTPEETRDTFLNKLKGVAQSNARLTIDRDRYKVTDELELESAKQAKIKNAYDGLYTSGDRKTLPTNNPFENLEFTEDGNFVAKPVNISNQIIQGADPLAPGNRRINQDALIDYNKRAQQANLKFKNITTNTPSLSNLKPEKAKEVISSYYNNLNEQFSGRANFDKNLDKINNTFKGNLASSTFMTKNGEVLNFKDLAETLGMTEGELLKGYQGGTGIEIDPVLGATLPIQVIDKKERVVTLYQQLDAESQAIVADTQKVLQHLHNEARSAEIESQPLGNGEYLNTYVINDFVNEPIVIKTTANLMPQDLKEFTGKSANEIKSFLPKSIVKGVKSLSEETSKSAAGNLQSKNY
jgi:hypothetical protein